MIRSASRQALVELRKEEDAVFDGRVSADTLIKLAGDLYAVADLLVAQPRLRRTLGDPATAPAGRVQLAESLVGGKIDAKSLRLVTAAIGLRWSTPWDLTDALEGAGDTALFAAAEKQQKLDPVEDELFRLERILQAEGEVAALLDEFTVDPARRIALLDALVGSKVNPITLELLHHAVTSQRKRSITLALDDLLEMASARRDRSVARVTSAVPLTDAQQDRLASALSAMYGRTMSVRTALDPRVQGGLIVRVGDEVIDGSIARKLATVRTALAG
ncbi:MAG: F-type H+-transporting ATPase subunit delta [Pseudonocardiales bacterium]|jgi:F-type H+-transporting ATPase subunit delta|nr:F-type H+-transporting ATPase subunit delta [Pseudonocardiales bacterium]MDT4920618.1 F-type H+-transporting ATPase subunit delta [Pseudonocardiales bacterium]